jgi:large subunit ribosomal protein L10
VVGVGKLDVLTVTELRNNLREHGLSFRVLKNRVATHALKDVGWDDVGPLLDGPSALAFGENGALGASKILVEWERKAPKALSIRGGLLDGKVLGVDEVRQLATIPDKPTLYSLLASTVVAPVSQVATLVGEVVAGVARAVGAVAEKKDEESEA